MDKIYKLNGIVVERPKSLIFNDKTYVPPTDEILLEYGYTIEDYVPTFDDVLSEKISLIEEYNISKNVDEFYINDMPMWLNRELRNSLMSRFNAEKTIGVEITNIWYEGMNFVLPVDNAILMLLKLEIYASQCFDNTHKHLYNINQLKTIDELQNYDYTTGYPEKLNFTI